MINDRNTMKVRARITIIVTIKVVAWSSASRWTTIKIAFPTQLVSLKETKQRRIHPKTLANTNISTSFQRSYLIRENARWIFSNAYFSLTHG